jgi:O-antigen ligase
MCFWGVLGVVGLRLAALGRASELMCVVMGLSPFVNLLRGFPFYNVVLVLFAAVLFYYYVRNPRTVAAVVRRTPFVLCLLTYVGVYYLLSFWFSGEYSKNLRMFELVLAAACVLLVGRNRHLLGPALLGMTISSCLVGVGMLPHSDSSGRLGMVIVDNHVLGNPAQLGLPLAVGFLALTVDRGRWLGLQGKTLARVALLVPTLLLMGLTTSRVAWLVAAAGLIVTLLFRPGSRLSVLLVIGVGALALQLLLISPYGVAFHRGLDRTFGDDADMARRTSGRSDQWQVAWHAATASSTAMLIGYGPGRGGSTYAQYSSQIEGVRYAVGKNAALHSLFMQVMVETGLAGLLPLVAGLVFILSHVWRWVCRTGAFFPPICFLGYMLSICTVAGSGLVDGFLLGTALLMTMRPPAARTATVWSPREAKVKWS